MRFPKAEITKAQYAAQPRGGNDIYPLLLWALAVLAVCWAVLLALDHWI